VKEDFGFWNFLFLRDFWRVLHRFHVYNFGNHNFVLCIGVERAIKVRMSQIFHTLNPNYGCRSGSDRTNMQSPG
jgi:hypothetical protein